VRVTLIRHAEAGDDAPRDEERALTDRGRTDCRRVGRALARRGVKFAAVISSPLVRAVQTAEIVLAALDQRVRVTVSDSLLPEARPGEVVTLLGSLASKKSVALVAHEPILSGVAAALLGLPRYPSLRKAEALRIRLPDGPGRTGTLRWRIDPDTGRRKRLT
jgi:phosphohistidine phosphatase